MDKDLVSIIMPAYNAGRFIEESIQSVINQTYQNWELIIIDDGSVDNTAEFAIRFTKVDLRIKYFYQPNGKQGKARNLGLKNSKGAYVAFLDADDKWTTDKLTIQTNLLFANKDIDLLFSQGYNLTGNAFSNMDVWVKEVWDHHDLKAMIDGNKIPILSVIVKKEALIKVGGFTEAGNLQNVEDYHLWLKLLVNNFKFKSTADRLFYYRIHETQVTYENKNLTRLCFNVYEDIYYWCKDATKKRFLINRLKWFLFTDEYLTLCINIFSLHFNQKGMKAITFMIKNLFNKPTPFCQKVVFKLVSTFA